MEGGGEGEGQGRGRGGEGRESLVCLKFPVMFEHNTIVASPQRTLVCGAACPHITLEAAHRETDSRGRNGTVRLMVYHA